MKNIILMSPLVMSRYPKGSDMLNKGMGLHLTISLSTPNFFQVPNLFGLSKKKAVADLERAGFNWVKHFIVKMKI